MKNKIILKYSICATLWIVIMPLIFIGALMTFSGYELGVYNLDEALMALLWGTIVAVWVCIGKELGLVD